MSVQCPRINDRLGRRWTFRLSTLIYIAGILGQGLCNGNLSGLYASRFIAGLGLGVLTIVPPIYISEVYTPEGYNMCIVLTDLDRTENN